MEKDNSLLYTCYINDMDFIDELINCLNSIEYSEFDEDYIDELLDSRDSDPFDAEWCRVNKKINSLKNDKNYTNLNKEVQGKIREKVFMIIKQNTESELSDYVSDDFGLIYDSFIVNYKDEWLNKFIREYKNRRIPAGEL
ncbi:hypothetical protein FDA09_00840 [Clostridium botulinum]|uniref:hypothetical protein n=1 Tax=Clostridium botulinum TaxID=1491 RepID=UPI000773B70F|nr:hypothetical protein [Clostridium botulinum]NFH80147.1 hypothetical protein [Clostridium botulinum]NFH81960.1 hypothetical protein [Clostridium botulinum]NFI09934.1 hypothetical protein [Clostridium botulinum]NFI15071.1 hypothetical protein [Clostridium botulinum]NFO84753.1 hypothetical protein [Clostridium botulinum]